MSLAVAPGRKLEKLGAEKFGTATPSTSVGATSGLNQRNVALTRPTLVLTEDQVPGLVVTQV